MFWVTVISPLNFKNLFMIYLEIFASIIHAKIWGVIPATTYGGISLDNPAGIFNGTSIEIPEGKKT